MQDVCYDCGKELDDSNRTKEHVPAKNLYDGFGHEFKKNRITVPACFECNNRYSKIDQEIRDLLAVKSNNLNEKAELTGKGIRSIFRQKNWKGRVFTDINGNAVSVSFDYNQLCNLHLKNFKALFFKKYGFPLPTDFELAIATEGDEGKIENIEKIHNYIRDGKEWEVSGSADVFKFIIKDITFDPINGYYESGDINKLDSIGGVIVYHDEIVAVILASKKMFIESCKPKD